VTAGGAGRLASAIWLLALGLLAAGVAIAAPALHAPSEGLAFSLLRGEERQQVKLFVYTVTVALGAVIAGFLVLGGGHLVPLLGAIPIAAAVAILKHRLYDIDRIINRTLVYALLSATLGLGYAGVVLALGQVLGQDQSSLAVAGATLAVAALFQPVRRRIQDAVDRRFNRRRYDAARTIAAFSARLREEVDLEALTAELLAVVEQTVQPTRASLWLRPPQRAAGTHR
jgi:hypothetical protein